MVTYYHWWSRVSSPHHANFPKEHLARATGLPLWMQGHLIGAMTITYTPLGGIDIMMHDGPAMLVSKQQYLPISAS